MDQRWPARVDGLHQSDRNRGVWRTTGCWRQSAKDRSGFDEIDDLGVQVCEPPIQGGEATAVMAGQRREMGVGDVGMSAKPGEHRAGVRLGVRPENVPSGLGQRFQRFA